MSYIVMSYIVMAYIVMAYIVMACTECQNLRRLRAGAQRRHGALEPPVQQGTADLRKKHKCAVMTFSYYGRSVLTTRAWPCSSTGWMDNILSSGNISVMAMFIDRFDGQHISYGNILVMTTR